MFISKQISGLYFFINSFIPNKTSYSIPSTSILTKKFKFEKFYQFFYLNLFELNYHHNTLYLFFYQFQHYIN